MNATYDAKTLRLLDLHLSESLLEKITIEDSLPILDMEEFLS